MNILLFLLATPILGFIQEDVQVSSEDDRVTGVYIFEFETTVDPETMFEELKEYSFKEVNNVRSALKEVEIFERSDHGWLVRHLYEVGFAVFKDRTEMLLEYVISRNAGDLRRLEWSLEESLDGKVFDSSGYWEVRPRQGGAGSQVRYVSTMVYIKKVGVAFALRNFSGRSVRKTLEALAEAAGER